MGRPKRADEAGGIYHMLNRANRRDTIFHKPADYEAFLGIVREALERCDVQLFSFCVLPNHWHMVVRPNQDGEMARFGHWMCLTHTQRYHAHYKTTGEGHLYQGRYKSFPCQSDEHFLTLNRYVERNAQSANFCEHAEHWQYGSLWHWKHGTSSQKKLLSPWPIARRPDWIRWVEMGLGIKETEKLQWCIKRGCPFGDETWVESTARRLDLESTMRPRGRPRKQCS